MGRGGGRKRSSQDDGRKWKVRVILGRVLGNVDSSSNSAKYDCDLVDNPISEPQSPHLLNRVGKIIIVSFLETPLCLCF